MDKKNIDWGNIGFGYIQTDKRYVSNYKDGVWDDGALIEDPMITMSECACVLQYAQTIFEGIKAYTTVDGLSGWCSAENLTENKNEVKTKETKPKSDEDKGRLVEPARRIETGYHGTVDSEGGLNLRCGPGSDYDILLVIPDKTEVVEEGWDGGWIYVKYDGEYGWINSEFVKPTGEIESAS